MVCSLGDVHDLLREAGVPKRQMRVGQAVSPAQCDPGIPLSLQVTLIYPGKNVWDA